jgi:hypothetical protein
VRGSVHVPVVMAMMRIADHCMLSRSHWFLKGFLLSFQLSFVLRDNGKNDLMSAGKLFNRLGAELTFV